MDAVALDERKAPHRSFIVIQFHAKEGESAPLVQQRGRRQQLGLELPYWR